MDMDRCHGRAMAIVAIAPFRTSHVQATSVPVDSVASVGSSTVVASTWWSAIQFAVRDARHLLDAPLAGGIAALQRRMPVSAGTFIVAGWFVSRAWRWRSSWCCSRRLPSSAAALAARRHPRHSRPRGAEHGTSRHGSRAAGDRGAAVDVGSRAQEQCAVLAHEAEHVRARDTSCWRPVHPPRW